MKASVDRPLRKQRGSDRHLTPSRPRRAAITVSPRSRGSGVRHPLLLPPASRFFLFVDEEALGVLKPYHVLNAQGLHAFRGYAERAHSFYQSINTRDAFAGLSHVPTGTFEPRFLSRLVHRWSATEPQPSANVSCPNYTSIGRQIHRVPGHALHARGGPRDSRQ